MSYTAHDMEIDRLVFERQTCQRSSDPGQDHNLEREATMGKVKIEIEVDSEDVLGGMDSRDILEHVPTEDGIRHGTKEAPWLAFAFLDEFEGIVHQFTDKAFKKLEGIILEEAKRRGEK